MSRWSSALPGRRGKPGTGRGRRGPGVAPNGSGPQAGGAPPVEEVDGVLLVRSVDDDSFPLATVADVAHALSADENIVTVMVGSADAGGTRDGDLWARLGALLDSLRAKGTRRIRLVMSGAGDDQPGRPCVARRIADAWQVEVIAPDGAVLITPGGALFVHGDSPPARGWWCFAPGEVPRKLGPRAPEPAWQEALGRVPARTTGGCVVDHIPAGVVMRPAEAPGPGLDDLCFAVPVDLDRPTVLVGALQAEDVAAGEVAAVLAALPVAQRSRARLAPGGRRDLLRLGQSVSDLLGSEVEVLTGLPLLDDYAPPGAAPRPTLVGTDGKPSWRPFVSSVACRPADAQGRVFAPRLVESRLPDWIPGGSEPGTVRLTDRWQAMVTRAGLALWEQGGPRPPMAGQTVDPDVCAIELGAPGQPLDDSLLLALSRLLVGLESEVRAKVTLLVRGRLTAGEGELRRLAGEHGVAAIRYVTARQPRHPGPAVHRPGSTTVGVAPAGAGPVAPLPRRAPALAGPAVPQAEAEPGGKNAATGSATTPGERRPVPRPPAPALRLSSPAQEAGTSQAVRTTAGNPGGVTARRTGHTPVPRVGGDSGVHTPLGPRPQPEAGAAGTAPEAEPATSTNAGAVAEESPPASGGTGLGPPGPGGVGDGEETGLAVAGGAVAGASAESGSASAAGASGGPDQGEGELTSGPVRGEEPEAEAARGGGTAVGVSEHGPAGSGAGSADEGRDRGDGDEPEKPGPQPRAQERPVPPPPAATAVPLPFVPGHVSGVAERAAFRDFAAADWERHAAAVSRVLTRMPALRGRELEAARTDLIAAHAYLTTDEGPLHHRELIRDMRRGEGRLLPYAGCLASALRRLPSYRGMALRGGDADGPAPKVGTLIQEPGPLSALAGSSALPSGVSTRYAIWSVTGRKVRQLLDRPGGSPYDEIVFVPGTGFRVLGVRTGPAGSSVVLLRELPGHATVYMDGAEELSGLDLKALRQLEEALEKDLPVGEGRSWPERCKGPVGRHG
ncbi:hypothetical protein [Streptomyces sp. A30]|uniref:hypothetical protein n=1 Tax=Streptomyces sp. A30 TaxID=2789273 RepID=UPI0039801B9F